MADEGSGATIKELPVQSQQLCILSKTDVSHHELPFAELLWQLRTDLRNLSRSRAAQACAPCSMLLSSRQSVAQSFMYGCRGART